MRLSSAEGLVAMHNSGLAAPFFWQVVNLRNETRWVSSPPRAVTLLGDCRALG